MPVNYIPANAKVFRFATPPKRTGYDEMGYCMKGSTDYFVLLAGSKKKYRVWVTCVSNCASHWIIEGGQKLHLPDLTRSEIPIGSHL